MFTHMLRSIRYTSISQTDAELAVSSHSRCSRLTVYVCCLLLSLLAGLTGFVIGINVSEDHNGMQRLTDTAPQVPIGWSRETFRFDENFAGSPPQSGGSEKSWDSLIPNGLGYVRNPTLAPNLSLVSSFHQLHCLYTLRRAFYSTSRSGELEDFDFGLDRASHASHCFEYLRQSIMCSADPTIEPAGTRVDGFLGWDFRRQCRNFVELKSWAEGSRAFEAHGFLAADLLHDKDSQVHSH